MKTRATMTPTPAEQQRGVTGRNCKLSFPHGRSAPGCRIAPGTARRTPPPARPRNGREGEVML